MIKNKNIILKVDTYRKLIRQLSFIDFYKKKIVLVCHSIYFNGYSLKLLKEFFTAQIGRAHV